MGQFQFACPNCNQALGAQDEWVNMRIECPSCHSSIIIPPRPAGTATFPLNPYGNTGNPAFGGPFTVTPFGNGKFSVSGDYYSLFSCVQQVFQDCQSDIKEIDPFQGKIVGKCKYGLNLFGITVTAIFYMNGNSTALEFSATLTDALDTMGACSKKVSEFSERFMGLASTFMPNAAGKPANFPFAPPAYSQRTGESHAGQAMTSFYLGLGGLLFSFLGIPALILGAVALNKMASSNNKEAYGFAVAGTIMGAFEVIIMLCLLLLLE